MQKFVFRFTVFLIINLFAFLALGYILDSLFGGGNTFKVVFLLFSVVPLFFFGNKMIQKTLKELNQIEHKKTDGGN